MKFASYQENNKIKLGIVQEDKLIDISSVYNDIFDVIEEGQDAFVKIEEFATNKEWNIASIDNADVRAPINKLRRNIICVGWNYLEHFNERHDKSIKLPDSPTIFTKATNTIIGPFSTISIDRKLTNKLDYEAELAVIISKQGKDILKEDAHHYIFGYTVANDISARDIQFAHGGQWFLGKSMDRSCPIGPYIVTKDEIPDIQNLDISCHVNDLRVQYSNTRLMMFSVEEIIAEISKVMTIEPGDVILTGTPPGIGSKRNPPLFLKDNDQVKVEIELIGEIKNQVKFTN